MVLIFYAFAREIRPFKRRLKARSALAITGLKGFRGWLGPTQVIGVATGIGMRRAERAAQHALDTIAAPALVVATGVSGALSEELTAGDLVLADSIIADSDGTAVTAAAVTIAKVDVGRFAAVLNRRQIEFVTGPILTTARVLEDAAAKRAAAARSGAIAVDMESAAVAASAQRRGLPFVCVRSVFDSVDEEVAGARLAGPEGEVKPLAAAGFMLRNPGAALQLPGMLRNLNRAAAALADALGALASVV